MEHVLDDPLPPTSYTKWYAARVAAHERRVAREAAKVAKAAKMASKADNKVICNRCKSAPVAVKASGQAYYMCRECLNKYVVERKQIRDFGRVLDAEESRKLYKEAKQAKMIATAMRQARFRQVIKQRAAEIKTDQDRQKRLCHNCQTNEIENPAYYNWCNDCLKARKAK